MKPPASPYYSPAGSLPLINKEGLSNIPILVTAFLAILATGGPTYSFGVYAATLKDTLSLTQSQLETLGASSFGAGIISWIPGLCVDVWGSRKALIVGGMMQCIGLLSYWIVARFAYVALPEATWVPILSLHSMLIFTANNLVIGGVFKAIVVSCGLGTKGKAVGAAKAYLGMGAGVFSSLFRALPTSSDLDFLAMSAGLAVIAIVLPALLGLPTKDAMETKGSRDESTDRHYTLVYAGLFALAIVVIGSSAMCLFRTSKAGIQFPEWIHSILILSLWIGPIVSLFFLPTQSHHRRDFRRSQSALRRKVRQAMELDHTNEGMPLLKPPGAKPPSIDEEKSEDSEEKHEETVCETPQPVKDRTLLQMLQTLPAWLFLTAGTILVGSGTMLTINMGQLVQSLGFPLETASACLAIFSVAQALARVTSGAVSEVALEWNTRVFGIDGVPRTAFLVVCCAFAVAGHAILATTSDISPFVLGIMFTGFSFGGLWPLMVLIVGDIFGTVNHGANYMFTDGFTCAVGTLSIAKYLTQSVYEMHIEGDETSCLGEGCFRETHFIISGLCMAALFSCVVLLYITRSSYGPLNLGH